MRVASGLIDGQGKTRVRLDKGMPLDFGNFDVVPVEVDERWGLMDAQGNWVLKPSLDDIDPFQDPGLAVFRRRYTPGYINLKGQEVIAPGDYGRVVRPGLIRAERRDHSFVDTSGKAAIAQRFGWVADFPTKGATVARKNGVWGLLNAQGEWVSAGPRREPWQVGPQRLQAIQGGLRVWSHAGQAIEWKNDAGQTVFRLTQGPGPAGKLPVLTLHAGDKTLWTSPPQRHPLDFTPTLEPQPEDLAALTGDALVAEAKRLLGAPARRFAPYSLVFHERRDAYDLNGLDEDEQENISLGGFTSLAQSYVSEEQWGSFEFLSDQRDEVFERIAAQSCQTLEAALGKSLPIPKGGERYWQGFTKRCMWQQGDRQLLLASFHETGDGEFEEQLALVVVAAP
ncbi:MAG: WG repeat-containing protein [Burkholderiaceae bacterium]